MKKFNITQALNDREKRDCGIIAPIIRNVLQMAAIVALGYLFYDTNQMGTFLEKVLATSLTKIIAAPFPFVLPAIQCIAFVWFCVLILHANNITEFDSEGVEAPGMKTFRICTVLLAITCLGACGIEYIFLRQIAIKPLVRAGISGVSFIIEFIMRNMPSGSYEVDPDDIDMDEYLQSVSQNGFASQYGAYGSQENAVQQMDPAAYYGMQPMQSMPMMNPQANFGFENYYDISEDY